MSRLVESDTAETPSPPPRGVRVWVRANRMALGITAAAVTVAVLLVGRLLVPGWIESRIEEDLVSLLGNGARIEQARLSTDAITVHDLSWRPADEGIELRIDTLRVEGDLLDMALRRAGAIRAVRLEGVGVRTGLDRVETREPPTTPPRADESPRNDSPPGPSPEDEAPRVSRLERFRPALDLLADDAEISLRRGSILGLERGEEILLLSDLEVSGRRIDVERLSTRGEATTEHGGGVLWELEIDLADPAASGRIEIDELRLAALLPLLPDLPLHRPASTRLGGRLTVRRANDDQLAAVMDLSIRNLGVASRRIAEEPINGVDLSLTGEASLEPGARRLSFRGLRLELERAAVELDGSVASRAKGYLVDVRVSMPSTPCQEAIHAIPAAVLGRLRHLEMSGTLAGRVGIRLDEASPDDTELTFEIDDRCEFVEVPEEIEIERLREPFHHFVIVDGEATARQLTGPGTPGWTPLGEISPFLIWAVLAHEDAAFFRHDGFAPWAIETALERNLEERRFAYGASTISMQLAKNLYLARDKTLSRKAREVLLTWWLETQLSKREILELYLNIIEYGPNLRGIRPAAVHYFGRLPGDLTPAESAFLATLLPAPSVYHRQYSAGELSAATREQMDFLLGRMYEKRWIDQAALQYGRAELESFSFHYAPGLRPPPARPGEAAALPTLPSTPDHRTPPSGGRAVPVPEAGSVDR